MKFKSSIILLLSVASAGLSFLVSADSLIYTYNLGDKQSLFFKDLNSGAETQLTAPHYNVWTASMSTSQDWIAYSSDESGTNQIYKMRSDGSQKQRLSFDNEDSVHPYFSPDGTRISFTRESKGEIVLMNADGSNMQTIANHAANDGHPMFSPDGKKILFHSDRLKNDVDEYGLFLFDLESREVIHTGLFGIYGRFSPDGELVTYMAKTSKKGRHQIYVANIVTPNKPKQLTHTQFHKNHPAFDAQGKRIVYLSWEFSDMSKEGTKSNEVMIMNLDGSNKIRLTKKNKVAWHPELSWN